MDASRELDALIAEKVFDFALGRMAEDEELQLIYDQATADLRDIPNYSTELSTAWEIVEKIGVRFCLIKEETSSNYTRPYKAWFTGFSVAYGTSPAHAICLAALKVMKRE